MLFLTVNTSSGLKLFAIAAVVKTLRVTTENYVSPTWLSSLHTFCDRKIKDGTTL